MYTIWMGYVGVYTRFNQRRCKPIITRGKRLLCFRIIIIGKTKCTYIFYTGVDITHADIIYKTLRGKTSPHTRVSCGFNVYIVIQNRMYANGRVRIIIIIYNIKWFINKAYLTVGIWRFPSTYIYI